VLSRKLRTRAQASHGNTTVLSLLNSPSSVTIGDSQSLAVQAITRFPSCWISSIADSREWWRSMLFNTPHRSADREFFSWLWLVVLPPINGEHNVFGPIVQLDTVFSMPAIMLIFPNMCCLNLSIKCKIVVCCLRSFRARSAPARHHGQEKLVTHQAEKIWLWRQRTNERPSVRP